MRRLIASRTPATSRRDFLRAVVAAGTVVARPGATAQAPAAQAPPGQSTNLADPSDVFAYRRNWNRWGDNDQKGAVNLITPQKRAAAARLVRTGRTVSLSRPFTPDQHFIQVNDRGTGFSVVDYYGTMYHGVTVTHVDALSHVWDKNGMWNGRDPAREIDTRGTKFADITAFGDGLVTRGVLLDVPRYRQAAHVTIDRPVDGEELLAMIKAQGVVIEPGDALFVYSGRESYVRSGPTYGGVTTQRPGLDVSCAKVIRDLDVAILGWDMHDAMPNRDGLVWPVHGVLYAYGVALVDNVLLEPLAQACIEERRSEFMFIALPLKIPRGTGSPANPIALF